MIHLDLSLAEKELLKDILDKSISDLKNEIINTDNRDFKEQLKSKHELLKKILASVIAAVENNQ